MSQDSREIERFGDFSRCPIPKTHRRLIEAHVLWHQALSQYQQPMHFQANLNGTIQALRNITFVLQSEKHTFNDFDAWYAPWQERMKAEPVLRWLRDARTAVVKQGELETSSTAIIKLVTWRDHVLAESTVPAEMSPELILRNLPLLELVNNLQIPPGDLESAAIIIERCWSAPNLEGREILDALGQAYGLLSDIIFDAHIFFRETSCVSIDGDHPHFRSAQHRTGTLACMALGVEDRTQTLRLLTSEPLQITRVKRPVTTKEVALATERYGFGKESKIAKWQEADPLAVAEHVLFRAKRILRKDKYHARMMFIRDGQGAWHRLTLDARNRTEKHLLMRMVARFVESVGADAIIEVGEAWALVEAESVRIVDLDRIQEAPGRKELLYVLVATRDGLLKTYDTFFTRGPFGGIKLGETEHSGKYQYYYLAPVFDVWWRQGTVTGPDGQRLRKTWDPDPLDSCYCGGANRFGECCKPLLDAESMREHIQRDIDSAMATANFTRAEELARAALAQYVIWVRQHTAPTMHVAQDLHRNFIGIDVPAVDAFVRQLAAAVVANKHSDFFLPQLHRVSTIIRVPELSARITALAAQWLLDEMGDPVGASKELESMGDLDKVTDTLALVLATRVFDWPTHKRTTYLIRAASGAYSDPERLLAELTVAKHLFISGEREKALQWVDSVIRETSGMIIHQDVFVDALILRWRVSGSEEDFRAAKSELEVSTDHKHQQKLAMALIDHGDFDEARALLHEALVAAEPVAQLLTVDAHLRAGRGDTAHEVLLNIAADDLPSRLRYPYAVAYSHVALACDEPEMKRIAAAKLRELPSIGTQMTQNINDLLDALGIQGSKRRADIVSRFRDLLMP
jgi:hypothetical protein